MSAPVLRLRDLHGTLRVRLGVAFVERFLNAMIIPVVTLYLSQRLGPAVAGELLGASVLVAVVASLVSGHIGDAYGRRRILLVASVGAAVAFAGMAGGVLAGPRAAILVYLFFVIHMASASSIQPVHDAMLVDVTVPEERKFVFTVNYWSFNAALAAGALAGTFLYARFLGALLLGGALVTVAATLVTYWFIGETAAPSKVRQRSRGAALVEMVRGYGTPLRDRRFVCLALAMTVVLGLEMQRANGYAFVRIAQHVPAQAVFLFRDVTGIKLAGILQAENTILVALLALPTVRLFRRFRNRSRLNLGIALFAVGCVVLVTSDLALALLGAVVLLTVGELLHIPVMQSLLADVVPENARTRYMAVFNLNIRGGFMIASLSLTVGAVVSPSVMAFLYLGLGALAVMLYRPLLRGRPAPGLASAQNVLQGS